MGALGSLYVTANAELRACRDPPDRRIVHLKYEEG